MLHESTYWRLVLNRNKDLLGKCFLALRRHVEAVPELTAEEWLELHDSVRMATAALRSAFAPDHASSVFLQNQDRHVHLHVVPRYDGERLLAGIVFADRGYPGHYRVEDSPRLLEPSVRTELVRRLEKAIAAALQGVPD